MLIEIVAENYGQLENNNRIARYRWHNNNNEINTIY